MSGLPDDFINNAVYQKLVDSGTIQKEDKVTNPKHYTSHPSGVECIQVTEHMGFNLGNAVKYIWRADLKGNSLQDLEKARWYIDREIKNRRASLKAPREP